MSVNLDIINKLEKSPKNIYIDSVKICIKLLENILNNPKEEKFRKFKKSNAKIAEKLLILDGMLELFIEIGFEIEDNEFILRKGGLGTMNKLKVYRNFLQQRLDYIINSNDSANDNSFDKVIAKPILALPRIVASKPFRQRILYPQILKSNNAFLKQLEQLSDTVMQYEDEALKKSALQIIPIEKLKLIAIKNLRKFQNHIKQKEITDDEPVLDDFILEELATWFKNDFFTWVDNMACKICKGETQGSGTKVVESVRIEQYYCHKCRVVTEFPRYNDIEKLLVTRSGRCGEFANCFTFLCRCLGYDARYIFSTSDHVWTEVYNHTKKRFIHIDPSENIFDSPLMYEWGWNKKLEYVIAFARDDVQDVTWRYSNRHEDILKRRNNCSERELISAIIELRNKRQSVVSPGRIKFLKMRTISELAELMIIREPTENEKKCRSSGSLQWRLQRGETNISQNFIFKLLPIEIKEQQFNLRYTCAKNRYDRFLGTNIYIQETTDDWKNWAYNSENIFRKVEHDHKMTYLARNEENEHGLVEWRFEFGDMKIKYVKFRFDTATFENGNVIVNFKNDVGENLNGQDDLKGKSAFIISVELIGGRGDCAWQHAQIFRQKINSEEERRYIEEIFFGAWSINVTKKEQQFETS